uniref:Fer2_2 domain-containing protein n=1 Tax=Syphacia muris TaxID=451379 RepID=A0A0N5AHA3_9BILA
MIAEWSITDSSMKCYAVNACLVPIAWVFGKSVITVEGIETEPKFKLLRQELRKLHGTRCGYCDSGFVMSMYSLLRENHDPSVADIEDAIEGNMCRCSGYRPILETFYKFSPSYKSSVTLCNGCKNRDQHLKCTRNDDRRLEARNMASEHHCSSDSERNVS